MKYLKVPWNLTYYYRADVEIYTARFFVSYGRSDLVIPRKTSEVAKENHLHICVNGDGFRWIGKKVRSIGKSAFDGKQINWKSRAESTMYISKRNEITFLRNGAIHHAISFPLRLIADGDMINHNTFDVAPRTIIGIKDGIMMFIVIEGVEGRSGASLNQAAELCMSLGCQNAINMDGGGSSAMCIDGELMNVPSDDYIPGHERPVANHFGVR